MGGVPNLGVFPYILAIHASNKTEIKIQTDVDKIIPGNASYRQSAFFFGDDNTTIMVGIFEFRSDGKCTYHNIYGSAVKSVTMANNGVVTITFPTTAYDNFMIMSGAYLCEL